MRRIIRPTILVTEPTRSFSTTDITLDSLGRVTNHVGRYYTTSDITYDSRNRIVSYTESGGGLSRAVTLTYAVAGGISLVTIV